VPRECRVEPFVHDSGVEALLVEHVGQRRVDRDAKSGMALLEAHHKRQRPKHDAGWHHEPKFANLHASAQDLRGLGDLFERSAGGLRQQRAGIRQCQSASLAQEQGLPIEFLEDQDLTTDCPLGHAEFLRGTREAARACRDDEKAQRGQRRKASARRCRIAAARVGYMSVHHAWMSFKWFVRQGVRHVQSRDATTKPRPLAGRCQMTDNRTSASGTGLLWAAASSANPILR